MQHPKLDPIEQEIYERHNARIATARQETHFRRASAYAPGYVHICGFACEQLTIRHLAYLEAISSPYLYRLPDVELRDVFLTPAATAQLLWILSPDFEPRPLVRGLWTWFAAQRAAFRERRILQRLTKHPNYKEVSEDAYKYIRNCFLDSPGSTRRAGESPVSGSTSFIDTFGHEYGWTREETFNLKVAEAMQSLTIINHRASGGQCAKFNLETDRIHQEMMKELTEHKKLMQKIISQKDNAQNNTHHRRRRQRN